MTSSSASSSPWRIESPSWRESSNDADSILVEQKSGRLPTGYACGVSIANWDDFYRRSKTLLQYYELLYPCDMEINDINTTLQYIASSVITDLAVKFDLLPLGATCNDDEGFTGLSAGDPDELLHVPCERLPNDMMLSSATPQCCQTVRMDIKAAMQDGTGESQIQAQLARLLNNEYQYGDIAPVQTLAIPDPFTSLHHSKAEHENNSFNNDSSTMLGDRGMTIAGGLLVSFLLASVLSFLTVAYRRSRRKRYHERMIDYKDNESLDGHNDSTVDPDSSSYSSHLGSPFGIFHEPPAVQTPPGPCEIGSFGIYRAAPPQDTSCYSMAQSLRDSIFWRDQSYRSALEMDEISEADSWAQTDATVGSLEERLEQITAEI